MKIALFRNLFVILAASISSVYSQVEKDDAMSSTQPFVFTRIYVDSAGTSHFSDEEMAFETKKFNSELPPVSIAKPNATSHMVVITAPSGGKADWHTVPQRQYNVIFSGEVEIEVSDGETRRFGPGSLILGEDTTGKGHITRVVGDSDVYFAVISLASD